MTAFSLLDLAPIVDGGTAAGALANSADLARHAETLGFARYSAATSRIRVGAGGIMLPNHAPIVIAEQFGTLDALFPGRIDLGLGRAPGSDQRVARALRRTLDSDPNAFPRDVIELQSYFADDGQTGIRAVPGAGANVPIWILGSSLFGAQLAAMLGLPYAFASHFAPDALDQALETYRRDFRPSAQLDKPYAMAGFNVFAADSDAEGELIASSQQQAFVALRTGHPRGPRDPRPRAAMFGGRRAGHGRARDRRVRRADAGRRSDDRQRDLRPRGAQAESDDHRRADGPVNVTNQPQAKALADGWMPERVRHDVTPSALRPGRASP